MSFFNFSYIARVMHGANVSVIRDRIWHGEHSSGWGCRKMRRLCGAGREAGDLETVVAPVPINPIVAKGTLA